MTLGTYWAHPATSAMVRFSVGNRKDREEKAMELWRGTDDVSAPLGVTNSRVTNTCSGGCGHRETTSPAMNHAKGLGTDDPEHGLAPLWMFLENSQTRLLTLRLGMVTCTFDPRALEAEADRFL